MSSITQKIYKRDFIVTKKLGSGKSAEVFQVQNYRSKKQFALKVCKFPTMSDLAQGINEIQLIKLINHEAVPKIHFFFTVQKKDENKVLKPQCQLGIIMEVCSQSLEAYINFLSKNNRRFYNEELWMFIKTMSSVFAKMQSLNILHRDIKPGNILVNTNNKNNVIQFKIADFGFSVLRNQYTQTSITGTQEYTSPRVRQKFLNPQQDIAEINFKDEVFSLGKTMLEMILKKNTKNQRISDDLFQKIIQKQYDPKLINLLRKMLQFNEKQRYDFAQLQEHLEKIYPLKKTISINLVNDSTHEKTHSKSLKSTQIPLSINLSQILHKTASVHMQIQTQQSRQITRNKEYHMKPNLHDGETIYLVNQSQEQSKNQIQKNYLRRKDIDFQGNQIFCVKAIGDYAFLGMNCRLAIIPLKNVKKNGDVFFIKFKKMQAIRQTFKIYNIFVFKGCIALLTEGSEFICLEEPKFVDFLNKMVSHQNNSELQLKRVCQNYYVSSKDSPRIFEINYDDLDVIINKFRLTCIKSLNHAFNGVQDSLILAYENGLISFACGQILIQDNQKIKSLQILSEYKLIYSTEKELKIVEFKKKTDPPTNQQPNVWSKIFDSEIVCFRIINHDITNTDEDDFIPLVEVTTKNGFQSTFDHKLEQIAQQILQKSELISHVNQTHFSWSFKKESKQNDLQFLAEVKQIQNLHVKDTSVCYLTASGMLKNALSRKPICPIEFKKVCGFHIDGERIVICRFDGKLSIIYTSTEPAKKSVKNLPSFQKSNKPIIQNCQSIKPIIQGSRSIKPIIEDSQSIRYIIQDSQSTQASQMHSQSYESSNFKSQVNMFKKPSQTFDEPQSAPRQKHRKVQPLLVSQISSKKQ